MTKKNRIRCLMFALLPILPLLAAAEPGEVVVLSRDFERDQSLAGCRNVSGKDISNYVATQCVYRVVTADDRRFLRSTKKSGIFGLTMPLKRTIVIGAGTSKVELRAKVRRTKGGTIAMALTSRTKPEGQEGQAFAWVGPPADSGISVSGYERATDANAIAWRVEGLSRGYSERKSLLPDTNWHEWRLVFDRATGTLALYTGEGGPTPVLVQKGVDLDGIVLRSFWVAGAGTSKPEVECFADYDDIVVSHTPAGQGK